MTLTLQRWCTIPLPLLYRVPPPIVHSVEVIFTPPQAEICCGCLKVGVLEKIWGSSPPKLDTPPHPLNETFGPLGKNFPSRLGKIFPSRMENFFRSCDLALFSTQMVIKWSENFEKGWGVMPNVIFTGVGGWMLRNFPHWLSQHTFQVHFVFMWAFFCHTMPPPTSPPPPPWRPFGIFDPGW